MSKISELSDGGVIQGGDTLIAVRSGGNVKVTYGGSTTANIDGGTIDGTVIGGSSAAAGSFTTLTADGLTVDGDVSITDNTPQITMTDADSSGNPYSRFYLNASLLSIDNDFGNTSASSYTRFTVDGTEVMRLKAGGDVLLYEDTGTTAKFFWDASTESLGIGTSTVSALLHLRDGSTEDVSGSKIRMDLSGINPYWELQARNGGSAANRQLGFYTSATSGDVLTLTQAGNVGIGTSSPSEKLEVAGAIEAGDQASGTTGQIIIRSRESNTFTRTSIGVLRSSGASYFGRSVEPSTSVAGGFNGGYTGTTGGGAWIIDNVGSTRFESFPSGTMTKGSALTMQERMRIDSSGNLLVGKTARATNTAGIELLAGGSSVHTAGGQVILANRIINDGNVVGFAREGTTVGTISVTASATAYNTSSDERLKENITDAPAGNVDDIKVRSFDWKADGSHQDYGMVAQELEAVAPYAVTKGETEDDMWSVDYSKLVPMLIKEIQDLKAEVAALKGA